MKNVSRFKSENLMNQLIHTVLEQEEYKYLACRMNQPLNTIIKDKNFLTQDEFRFVGNSSTHLDFIIYSQISNNLVLAIEVDGVKFHENSPTQLKRDKMKDIILKKYNIPMIRFPTNGSEEKKKLLKKFNELNL